MMEIFSFLRKEMEGSQDDFVEEGKQRVGVIYWSGIVKEREKGRCLLTIWKILYLQ